MNHDISAPPPLAGRRILVADDSLAARIILQGILERAGAAVTAVADGTDAVDQMRSSSEPFDAVVLDVVMEHLGGIDAARRIRALPGGGRVALLLTSARVDAETRELGRAVGAFPEFLGKPVGGAETVRLVAAALGQPVTGPAPRAPAGRAQEADPQLPGYDLPGALERCGGDRSLLLRLHAQLLRELPPRATVTVQALRGRLYRIARVELHRIRGDLLNLGFLKIAGDVAEIEERSAELAQFEVAGPEDTVPSGFMEGGERLADRLSATMHALAIAAGRVRQIPSMAQQAPTPAAPDEEGPEEEAFCALVTAVERDDLAAIRMIERCARVLPLRYPRNADAAFRACVEQLDFQGALRLLDGADRSSTRSFNSSGFRLLVVDDMPSAVMLLFRMIENIGRVRFALSGEHALEIARAWSPDLVISDVHLGGMSGIDLCRGLKGDPRTADAAVMLVSSDGDIAVEVEGLTAGASDFLSKPLVPSRVVGRVNAQLAGLRRQSAAAAAIVGDASSVALGFITSTFGGQVIDLSPRIARELAKGDVGKGAGLRELFVPDSSGSVERALSEIATTGRAAPFEASLRGIDGVAVPVRAVAWAAPGADGRVAWMSIEDRRDRLSSERRRLEDEISRTIGVMAGGMAHEFNNLLNVAIGNIDLVLDSKGGDEMQRERLSRASGALLRAADVSRQLADFGLRGERSDLPQPIDQALDQIWPFIANSVPAGFVLVRERANEDVPIRIDSRGLRSALSNLLQNAYDSMPGGGQVFVRTWVRREPGADGPIVNLDVTDGGAGMSEAVRLRAFEPFFTTRAPGRTGLGLTQVRGFVQRHRGVVSIDSTPGSGTTVRIEFDA